MARLKFLMVAICLTMIAVTVWASLKISLFDVLPDMLQQPWMKATLIDFYFNILIIWCYVLYTESQFWKSLLWLVAFVALGSIATSAYVFLQLSKKAWPSKVS